MNLGRYTGSITSALFISSSQCGGGSEQGKAIAARREAAGNRRATHRPSALDSQGRQRSGRRNTRQAIQRRSWGNPTAEKKVCNAEKDLDKRPQCRHSLRMSNTDHLTMSAISNIVLSDQAQLEALVQLVTKESDRIWKRWKIADGLKRSDRKPLEKRIKALVEIRSNIQKLQASLYDTETVPHL